MAIKVKLISVKEINSVSLEQREEVFNKLLEDIEGDVIHIEREPTFYVIFYKPVEYKVDLSKQLIIK